MIRDVLVFTPVLRLEAETVKALFALEWDGPLSVLFQRDNPIGHPKLDHFHQYRRGRETFLAGSYDAMLVVESDIVPPPETLKRLVAVDADVAYGCYLFRSVRPVVNVFERYPGQARNMGESLMAEPGLWKAACRQGIVECSGAGLGCVLIKRHVLEAVGFRLDDPTGVATAHCDTFWTMDVYQAGYSMLADTGVLCEHIDVDGSVMKFQVVDG